MATLHTAIVSYRYEKIGINPNKEFTKRHLSSFKFQSESSVLDELESLHPECEFVIKDLEWK